MLMSLVNWSHFKKSNDTYTILEQPKGEDYVDENGVRTTVEYTVNDEGKKVKVCYRPIFLLLLAHKIDPDHEEGEKSTAKISCKSQRSGKATLDEIRQGERK